MAYTPKQQEYIDSVEGEAHWSAVRIIGELENELKPLKDFARHVIKQECWGIIDGGDIQDMAEKLVLIKNHVVTIQEEVDAEFGDHAVGDKIKVFTDILKEENNGKK